MNLGHLVTLNLNYFHQVHNVCEDFYQSASDGSIPEFDVLVTNPPYTSSAPRCPPGSLFHGTTDHVERLLRYCRSCGKPCALLMPNYVSRPDYLWSPIYICVIPPVNDGVFSGAGLRCVLG